MMQPWHNASLWLMAPIKLSLCWVGTTSFLTLADCTRFRKANKDLFKFGSCLLLLLGLGLRNSYCAQYQYVMNHFFPVGCDFYRMVLWYGSIPWVPTQPCSRSCSWSWQGNVCMPVGFLSLTWRRTSTLSVSVWTYDNKVVHGFFNLPCYYNIDALWTGQKSHWKKHAFPTLWLDVFGCK